MFKFGHDKTKGCNGKNCNEFHPNLCKKSLKGDCDGRDCKDGFHLRSVINLHKKNKKEKVIDDNKAEEVKEKNKESNEKDKEAQNTFLEKLTSQLAEMQKTQILQQEKIEKLMKNQESSPPEWLKYMMPLMQRH